MKRVLITGKDSYIGTSFISWVKEKHPGEFETEELDMIDGTWKEKDFSGYDAVFHVAGLAHADVGHVSAETKAFYYKINRDLAIEVAKKSKREGVKQFIFMSSMIIYSGCKEKIITKDTTPSPLNFYGDSKWQADKKIRALETQNFRVAVLRPPMIYGKNSKGNYLELAKLAKILPVFPVIKNRRSMLYIENLCEFVRLLIDNEESGVFFPQNKEYTVTSDMVRIIAKVNKHRIVMILGLGWVVKLIMKLPGKIGGLATKAFGDFAYDQKMSKYKKNYQIVGFKESIKRTER